MNQFRKYARYVILFILFGMLIVSFGLWGVGDMLKVVGRSSEVAHVGGTKIPLYGWVGGAPVYATEVREQFNRQLEAIQRQTGQRRSRNRRCATVCMCGHSRSDPAHRARLCDPRVRTDRQRRGSARSHRRNPAFQGTGGSFDPLLYRNRLQQARISEPQFVLDMRREIAASQLFGAVRADGLAPVSLRDQIFKLESEKRTAETIYIPDAIVVDVPKPTPEQLNSYFEANKAKFQIPEFRAFSYVMITVDDVQSQVAVTSDAVRQEYEARAAEFGTPEKRDVDQAMTDTRTRPRRSSRPPRVASRWKTPPRK